MLAEQVRRSLRAPMKIAGKEIVLTASIGIVVYDGVAADGAELLREAEIAMYRAKRAGADRIEIFNACDARRGRTAARARKRARARRSRSGRSRSLYQPITRLAYETAGRLRGADALGPSDARHARPDDFVPIAEETELIVKLGSYVLAGPCGRQRAGTRCCRAERDPLFVSVNVSSRQLFRPELVQEIGYILGRGPCPEGHAASSRSPSRWSWRIRSAPSRSSSWLKSSARAWRSTISAPAIRSLSYLNRFPFDTIKVDRSFVHDRAARTARRRDPALDRGALSRARQEGGGRGRRDRGGRRLPALDRLRIRPGLLLRRADDDQGGGGPVVGARKPPQAAAAREVEGGGEGPCSSAPVARPVAQAAPPRPDASSLRVS